MTTDTPAINADGDLYGRPEIEAVMAAVWEPAWDAFHRTYTGEDSDRFTETAVAAIEALIGLGWRPVGIDAEPVPHAADLPRADGYPDPICAAVLPGSGDICRMPRGHRDAVSAAALAAARTGGALAVLDALARECRDLADGPCASNDAADLAWRADWLDRQATRVRSGFVPVEVTAP